jgi:hypothetical protein
LIFPAIDERTTGPVIQSNACYAIAADLPGASYSTIAWGDYDNDGDLDLAMAGYAGWITTKIYCNVNGSYVDAGGLMGVEEGALAWGDYDNDGDLDIAVAGSSSLGTRITYLYRNDNLSFQEVTGTPIAGIYWGCLGWGDYDNDGDIDLAVAGDTGAGYYVTRVYRNDDRIFLDATGTALDAISRGTINWGDYDNDGDLDLAVGGWSATANNTRVYRNDNSRFVNATGTAIPAIGQGALAWGDYDNDGDLDLVLTADASDYTTIYRNDAGSFVNATGSSMTGVVNSALAWGDYDLDGDLDLAIAGYAKPGQVTEIFRVYRNENCSFTADNGIVRSGAIYGALAFGDGDNDGDPDLAITGSGKTQVIKFLEPEFYGTTNTAPAPPSTDDCSASYDITSGSVCLKWGYGSDTETTQQKGLYYDIRVASYSITDSLTTWIISPSTGAGATPLLGNYPHGFCVAATTQPGVNFGQGVDGATYYWQVRTIDTGF